MAHGYGPLSAHEFELEMKRLVQDLAFYARGPVRMHLVGGDHIAFTYNTEDKLHAINIVLNPSRLNGVRHKGRAIAILRGIGFHELAHHLWPAEAQYKEANQEGFMSLFNLIDDEQNERRGRALDPKWGACFQTVCAYIFPARKKRAKSIDVGIEDSEETAKKPEGMEAHETYASRWNEFAFHFRRHIPGVGSEQVRSALALIPPNFKELSKPDLLVLTRAVHLTLSKGIELTVKPSTSSESPVKEEDDDTTNGEFDKFSPATDSILTRAFWKSLFHSKWTYVILAMAVMVWGLLFMQGGSDFWNEVFWWVLKIAAILALLVGIRAIIRRLNPDPQSSSLNVKPPGLLKRMLAKGKKALTSFLTWTLSPVSKWKFWLRIGDLIVRVLSRLALAIEKAYIVVRNVVLRMWKNRHFRIVLIALGPALWTAMLWGVFTHAAQTSWLYVIILALWLLVMLLLVWIFRKRLKDFLLGEFAQDMSFPYNFHLQMEMDKETLEFNVVESVVPVQADPEYLASCIDELYPLARQLQRQLANCGNSVVDIEGQPDGYDFIDDIEAISMGETSVFVDDTEERRASLHVEVAVDCSSSMLSANETLKDGEKFDLAKKFALLVELAIQGQPGMSGKFWGFTDREIFDCGKAGEGRISGLVSAGGNNDSAMLWHMGQSAARSDKTVKLLFMLSDGQPSDCSWGSLNNLVIKLEAEGMIPWQFALDKINDPAFERYFTDLCGQSMAEAIMTMGRTIASLAEGL